MITVGLHISRYHNFDFSIKKLNSVCNYFKFLLFSLAIFDNCNDFLLQNLFCPVIGYKKIVLFGLVCFIQLVCVRWWTIINKKYLQKSTFWWNLWCDFFCKMVWYSSQFFLFVSYVVQVILLSCLSWAVQLLSFNNSTYIDSRVST